MKADGTSRKQGLIGPKKLKNIVLSKYYYLHEDYDMRSNTVTT